MGRAHGQYCIDRGYPLAEMLQCPVGDVFLGIRGTRPTAGSSRQIEWQIANISEPSPSYKSIKHFLLIFVP